MLAITKRSVSFNICIPKIAVRPVIAAAAMVAWWFIAPSISHSAQVTVESCDVGATISIDGELFAKYQTLSRHQPAVWPIIGPTGHPMTRSYPLGPLLESERDDHPHHHSLWFAHESVNGHNFWLEPKPNQSPDKAKRIKHVEFVRMESGEGRAVLVARNQWLAGKDSVVCEDERTLVFGTDGDSRWIDFTVKILATHGPVTFGDVKDGAFSTRIAGTMKVDSGGTLVNSVGQKNTDAWGMPAEWIDNYGQLGGETVGLAMFSHPSNYRHPTRWHVRNYGLLCANPFGEQQFPPADIRQQGHTIEAGESLTLRYRVYLHHGDTVQGKVADAYRQFAAHSLVEEPLPLLMKEEFQNGMERWVASDANLPNSVWSVEPSADNKGNSHLRVNGMSKYQPPHRSPHSIALLKEVAVSDFELTARVQNTNVNAGGHRDLCFFWGYQDPAHFYYAHLGSQPDAHSSQIFIVNDAPRKMITTNDSPGIPWSNGWHDVKVTYRSSDGLMQVFFDNMQTPVFIAKDKTYNWGRVGVGTFDDNGNFDNIQLRGKRIRPIPTTAKLPTGE